MTDNLPATVSDIERMAIAVANSRLFGMKNKDEAMALMLIAHAEGMHPAIAATHYHIINGRPSLKADAMLTRFQAAGGSVKWNKLSDEVACAEFTHPQGGTVEIEWDIARAKRAQISNPMWTKYPRQMLRARVISEGIRTVYPGVSVGMYTPEEVSDFEPTEKPAKRERIARREAIDVESKPVTIEERLGDELPNFDVAVIALEDEAKLYAELIKGATIVDELDDEVKTHVMLMSKLANEKPAYHARLVELIKEKRTEFSKKPKRKSKPIDDNTDLNDALPDDMQPTAAEKLAKQLEEVPEPLKGAA